MPNFSDIIFHKKRFNRRKLLTHLASRTSGKKPVALQNLRDDELQIATELEEHIEGCAATDTCSTEIVYERAIEVIELWKTELISQKTLWENIKSNPLAIGILLVGLANVVIALVNLYNALGGNSVQPAG